MKSERRLQNSRENEIQILIFYCQVVTLSLEYLQWRYANLRCKNYIYILFCIYGKCNCEFYSCRGRRYIFRISFNFLYVQSPLSNLGYIYIFTNIFQQRQIFYIVSLESFSANKKISNADFKVFCISYWRCSYMLNTELLCLQFTLCYLFTLQINCNNGQKVGFYLGFLFYFIF